MASRSRSRKRKSRRLGRGFWAFYWLVCIIATLAVGAFASEWTHVRHVEIYAENEQDWPRLEKIVEHAMGIPALQTPSSRIEALVEEDPIVEYCTFQADVLGRAVLTVFYRRPVAKLTGVEGFAVDSEGVLFRFPQAEDLNLGITMNVQENSVILTICDPGRLRQQAELAEKLQVLLPKLEGNIDVDDSGRLCLSIVRGARVIIGTSSRLEAKLEVLAKARVHEPDRFAPGTTINVIDPDSPTVEKP